MASFTRSARPLSLPLVLVGVFLSTAILGVPERAVAGPCPRSATFTSPEHATTVDLGWTGLGHGLALGALRFTVGLGLCASDGDGSCGDCAITGLVDDGSHRRCSNDAARSCQGPADCQEDAECQVYLGPPLAVSAGGAAWCLLPALATRVQGHVDPSTGSTTLDLPLTLGVYEGSLGSPCPRCVGDPTPMDGQRRGTCDGGAQAKAPCDAGAATDASGPGAPSLDCPPAAAARFGALTDRVGSVSLQTATQTRRVTDGSPGAKAPGRENERSLCGVCTDDPTKACASSADCTGGACGGSRGAPGAPNACEDGLCASADGVHGTCTNGPFDGTCRRERWRSCVSDAECPLEDDRCQVSLRKCYPGRGKTGDGVAVRGSSEVVNAEKVRSTLGALFCIPPGQNSTTNQLFGLPGLGRVLMAGTWTFQRDAVEVLP